MGEEEFEGWAGPSRSQRKRDAQAVFELAERLVAMPGRLLATAPMDEALRQEVLATRATPSHIARKRQMQFLAKQLRVLDEEARAALRAVVLQEREETLREAAALHRLESLRERLLEEGDAAVEAVLGQHPQADRQHLRTLVRNARAEREAGRPPRASRELFRLLRELSAETPED